MHVLVEDREQLPVAGVRIEAARSRLGGRVTNSLDVVEQLAARRQLEIPAHVVIDRDRIVQGVCVAEQRLAAVDVTQGKTFLKVRDVPDLPVQRIDDVEPGDPELRVTEVGHQLERPLSRVGDPLAERPGLRLARELF